jgi:hypothetical protein
LCPEVARYIFIDGKRKAEIRDLLIITIGGPFVGQRDMPILVVTHDLLLKWSSLMIFSLMVVSVLTQSTLTRPHRGAGTDEAWATVGEFRAG